MPHGAPNRRPKLHQRVERSAAAGVNPTRGLRIEQAQPVEGGEIDDLIADRHPTAKFLRAVGAAKHGEGQILDGEFAVGPIGRLHPAAYPRIVRLVEQGGVDHGRAGWGHHCVHKSPGQQNAQSIILRQPSRELDNYDQGQSTGSRGSCDG